MSFLVALLIITPLAFLAGWMLSKAYFSAHTADTVSRQRHYAMLRAQRDRYRRRIQAVHNLVRRHEETRDQIRSKLDTLQKGLAGQEILGENAGDTTADKSTTGQSTEEPSPRILNLATRIARLQAQAKSEHERAAAAENELSLLRIERQELEARVKRLESGTQPVKMTRAEARETDLKAEMGALREELKQREHRIKRLEAQLADSEARVAELEANLRTWKHRVSPLAKQLQLQRDLIRKVNDTGQPTTVYTPPDSAVESEPEAADDLQQIRGIGPALERRLNAHGIWRFVQIADMSAAELSEVAGQLSISPTLPERDEWIRQARDLYQERYRQSA